MPDVFVESPKDFARLKGIFIASQVTASDHPSDVNTVRFATDGEYTPPSSSQCMTASGVTSTVHW